MTSENVEEIIAQLDSTISSIGITTGRKPQEETIKVLNSKVLEFIDLQESALTFISETLKPASTVKKPTQEADIQNLNHEGTDPKHKESLKEPLKVPS